MNILIVAVIACSIGTAFMGNIPSVRKCYRELDDRSLVDRNVQAKHMAIRLVVSALQLPLPLAFLSFRGQSPEATQVFHWLLVVIPVSTLCASWFFREIYTITRSEMECRKFTKEKDGPTEQTHAESTPKTAPSAASETSDA